MEDARLTRPGSPGVMEDHEKRRAPQDRDREEDEAHNRLGYRNVDEEAEHDERGSQGPGPRERPPDEG